MTNNSRNQVSKVVFFIVFIFLLLWNLGTVFFPISALQVETGTSAEEVSQTEDPNTATPTSTPTITLTSELSTPIAGLTPSSESNTPVTNIRPLPAIFATGPYVPNELIVRFKNSIRDTRIDECLQGVDVNTISRIEELRAMVLEINSGNVANVYNHILNCAGVLYVEPDFLLQAADTVPNDPNWGIQYGLVNIRASQGWDLTTGSTSVTIAIVDTGVDLGHLDLAGKLVAGYDFVNSDTNPQDDNGHGTHVAGIAAAISNNGAGIAGVSWGAHIMPVKVLNDKAGGSYSNVAQGTIWAANHGAQVINLSLGGGVPSSVMEDAINYAHSKGVVVVAAAGNSGSNFVLYPARYPNVIAVASTNSSNNWAGSNYGPEIDLSAPGALIYSTITGGYDYKSGSSMATGFVSGLASILMGIPGNGSPDMIEFQMESTALDIEFAGWDEYTGAGLIQMDAAIQLAWPPTPMPDNNNSTPAGFGVIPEQIAPTNTPIPTWTSPPITPTEMGTNTPITSETGVINTETPTKTNSATLTENEVKAQADNNSNTYTLPCTGILFILLGAIWFWFFTQKRKRNSP